MSLILQIVLAVAIVLLTVFLVLLLVQARRTAASVQRLAESARQDLHQIAADIHEVRAKVEEVTDLAKGVFELPSLLTQVVAGIVRGIPGLLPRRTFPGRFFEAFLTGLHRAVHLLRGRKAGPPEEGSRE